MGRAGGVPRVGGAGGLGGVRGVSRKKEQVTSKRKSYIQKKKVTTKPASFPVGLYGRKVAYLHRLVSALLGQFDALHKHDDAQKFWVENPN